jgi:nucleotidyltransferase substrate binding protein (TIGR01987 family)
MAIKLTNFKKAVITLEKAFIEFRQHSHSTLMRDGVIQRFEYTYESAWKLIKRYLEEEMGETDADTYSKRELFRHAAEAKLIQDPEQWFLYHQNRNITSHTYNEIEAEKVFDTAVLFEKDVKNLLIELEKRLNK